MSLLPRLFILFIASAAALDNEYPGYYHFKKVSMEHAKENFYVTPGDGAHALGYQKMEADLELAKHFCDQYDSCQWFDSSNGYPGDIGWWQSNATVDTYVKKTTGTVVNGSFGYDNRYMRIFSANIYCRKIAGPWLLPPDQVKAQCDELVTCHGFTVMNDLSSGFLCAFNDRDDRYDSYLKLPNTSKPSTKSQKLSPNWPTPTLHHDGIALSEYQGYFEFKGNMLPISPLPPGDVHCPMGQRVDVVQTERDNGSCDCATYCASDWNHEVTQQRPHWRGSTSLEANRFRDCRCIQATHWCKKTTYCKDSCDAAGLPAPDDFCVGVFNTYVTPGDGAAPLGALKTPGDLELAKHLCDRYDSCMWFDSSNGYPGSIGSWVPNSTQTTYLKHTAGTIVPSSAYYSNSYMRIHGVDVYCNLIAGPWQLPPDQVKAQCDELVTCHGFTVMNDLSSGFLCAFNNVQSNKEAFIKLPAGRVAH